MKFEAKGTLTVKKQERKFTRKVEAEDESKARDKVYALLGSEHKAKRRHIQIEEFRKE